METMSREVITVKGLKSMLNKQVATLIKKEYDKVSGLTLFEFLKKITPLYGKLSEIAEEFEKRPIEDGHIPILLVIKKDFVPIYEQIIRIEVDGKKGHTYFNLRDLDKSHNLDKITIPQNKLVYLAIDIEDGKNMREKCPDDAERLIEKANRSPFVKEEGFALTTHFTETLKDHHLDLIGSRYGSDFHLLDLRIDDDGRPKLVGSYSGKEGNPNWGAPSCRDRV